MTTAAQRENGNVLQLFDSDEGAPNAGVVAAVVSAAADIAFVLDGDDRICDIVQCEETLDDQGVQGWLNKLWTETVTEESHTKIADLLRAARGEGDVRWRQVNHIVEGQPDLPVRYTVVSLGAGTDRVLALGRELRSVSLLQQELVTTQQAMEREYMRLRHAETRYRALFQVSTEAVLVIDAQSNRISDANPAAIRLMDSTAGQMIGRPLKDWMAPSDHAVLADVFSSVRRSGIAAVDRAHLAGASEMPVTVHVSLFRQGANGHFLVRLSPQGRVGDGDVSRTRMDEIVGALPEGFVITDLDTRILGANAAFLDLIQLPTIEAALGEPLTRWLGRSDYEMKAMLSNLTEHGVVRLFTTTARGELGSDADVAISAVCVTDGEAPCLGFSLRTVESRGGVAEPEVQLPGPRSVEQLTQLVGRVSLKELVRDATEIIERLSIEAALEITGDNRASAAEMLGLSRQSLYAKLHRYGIGDLPGSGGADGDT